VQRLLHTYDRAIDVWLKWLLAAAGRKWKARRLDSTGY
jgi:hypothetical protein